MLGGDRLNGNSFDRTRLDGTCWFYGTIVGKINDEQRGEVTPSKKLYVQTSSTSRLRVQC